MRSAIALALCLCMYGTHARSAGHLRQRQLSAKCQTRKVCHVRAADGTRRTVTFTGAEARAADEELVAKARAVAQQRQEPGEKRKAEDDLHLEEPAAKVNKVIDMGSAAGTVDQDRLETNQTLTGDGSHFDISAKALDEHVVMPGEMDACYTLVFPPSCNATGAAQGGVCQGKVDMKSCVLAVNENGKPCKWLDAHPAITTLAKGELASPNTQANVNEVAAAEGVASQEDLSQGKGATSVDEPPAMEEPVDSEGKRVEKPTVDSGGKKVEEPTSWKQGWNILGSLDEVEETRVMGNGPAMKAHCAEPFHVKSDSTQALAASGITKSSIQDHINAYKTNKG